jgi:glutamate/tyrosine decarboxylase-like PLP-dependent enzyme
MPSSLDLDLPTMRRLGYRVTDLVANHLASLREQPTNLPLPPETLQALLGSPAPEQGRELEALLATLEAQVLPYHTREPHPGFMAYVQSCSSFPAVLGDWLATGFNFFTGVWSVAPGPNALELLVLQWFRQWLGMPAGTSGLLTTGGSAATLTATIAARHAVAGEDASKISQLTLYTSEQAHSSVIRAAWIAGLSRSLVRLLPVDEAWQLRPDALAAAIADDRARGLLPAMLVAAAGTTNTGAVDPLPALAELCSTQGIWLHVDAAYGGFAVLTPRGQAALEGIGRADSVTLDPHKWLFVPFECGCLLVREPRRLEAAFRIVPEYLRDAEAAGPEVNFTDRGEQLSRYARALKVWLAVSHYGTAAIGEAIEAAIARADYAECLLRAQPGIEILSPARLGILCFRVHPQGLDDPAVLAALNARVLEQVNQGRRYFLSSTRLRGTFSLRLCTPGFRTTRGDIEGVVEVVVKALSTAP